MPAFLTRWEKIWVYYATLSVMKWSSSSVETTVRVRADGSAFDLESRLDNDSFIECAKVASLAWILAELANLRRWNSKGAKLKVNASGLLEPQLPPGVQSAVQSYERRRPRTQVLQDEGVYLPLNHAAELLLMRHLDEPLAASVVGSEQRFFIHLIPQAVGADAMLDVLRGYATPLKHRFGAGPDVVMFGLYAISQLVWFSVPPLPDSDHLLFTEDASDAQFWKKFDFFVGLGQRGFLRFPTEYLKASMKRVPLPTWIGSRSAPDALVDRFFHAFAVSDERCNQIEPVLLQPFPILFVSASGNCYFDFTAVLDFARWLIVAGQAAYKSQHGDWFTHALREQINSVAEARVLRVQEILRSPSGEVAEVDLLVRVRDVAFAIECKAYAKSRLYWYGKPSAIARRSWRISESVTQAKYAARVVESLLGSEKDGLAGCTRVEWAVCSPTQEYLNPLGVHGLLSEGVPRVCTPEELIAHFRTEAKTTAV